MKKGKYGASSLFMIVTVFLMCICTVAFAESATPAPTPNDSLISELSGRIAAIEAQLSDLESQKSELENQLKALQTSDGSAQEMLFDYKALARDPDKFIGQKATFSGTILQVLEDNYSGEVQFRIATKSYADDIVYATYTPEGEYSRFLEDDKVYVSGTFDGLTSYEALLGNTITIPSFTIDEIGLVNGDDSPFSVKADDFVVDTYAWETRYYKYCALAISSKAPIPVSLDIALSFYDAKGNMVGVSNQSVDVIGPNEQTISVFTNDVSFAKVEYEIVPSVDPYYSSPLTDLSYKANKTGKKIIVELTNNGEQPAEFVEGYILFMYKGKVVDYERSYFTDGDFEIKPGKKIFNEFKTSERFDDIKVFFTGKVDK